MITYYQRILNLPNKPILKLGNLKDSNFKGRPAFNLMNKLSVLGRPVNLRRLWLRAIHHTQTGTIL